MKRIYKISRNHIITGFIFLMPVLITLAVIGKFWNSLLKLGSKISKIIHVQTLLGPSGDAVMAVIIFLLLCVLAGFLVKMSVFKKLSESLDETLASFIPGYSDAKKQTEIKIGKEAKKDVFETCLVQTEGAWKPGYLIEVDNNGDAIVYIPTAPAFSTGQVLVASAGTYKKLKIDSNMLNAYLGKLGKGLKISRDELV